MSTSFGWEGKGRYGSFRQRMNAGCAGETVRSIENVCHVHDKALYKSTFTFTLLPYLTSHGMRGDTKTATLTQITSVADYN